MQDIDAFQSASLLLYIPVSSRVTSNLITVENAAL